MIYKPACYLIDILKYYNQDKIFKDVSVTAIKKHHFIYNVKLPSNLFSLTFIFTNIKVLRVKKRDVSTHNST